VDVQDADADSEEKDRAKPALERNYDKDLPAAANIGTGDNEAGLEYAWQKQKSMGYSYLHPKGLYCMRVATDRTGTEALKALCRNAVFFLHGHGPGDEAPEQIKGKYIVTRKDTLFHDGNDIWLDPYWREFAPQHYRDTHTSAYLRNSSTSPPNFRADRCCLVVLIGFNLVRVDDPLRRTQPPGACAFLE